MTMISPTPGSWVVVHPLIVRLTHWINAFAILCMVMSGWLIYNASPLFGFTFPAWATLGGWLGGAIAWHLAAMWLLVANGLVYFIYGLLSRHLTRSLLPLTPKLVWRDARDAMMLRLKHKLGAYNAVQRAMYAGVLVLGMLAVASGLMLWKPIQFEVVANLFGGYEVMRRVHFVAMAGIVGFVVIHLALVILVPSTLPAMITGRARIPAEPHS